MKKILLPLLIISLISISPANATPQSIKLSKALSLLSDYTLKTDLLFKSMPYAYKKVDKINKTTNELKLDKKGNFEERTDNKVTSFLYGDVLILDNEEREVAPFEEEIINELKLDKNLPLATYDLKKIYPTAYTKEMYIQNIYDLLKINTNFLDSFPNLEKSKVTYEKIKGVEKLSIENKAEKNYINLTFQTGFISKLEVKNKDENYIITFKINNQTLSKPTGDALDMTRVLLHPKFEKGLALFQTNNKLELIKKDAKTIAEQNNRNVPNQSDWDTSIKNNNEVSYDKGIELTLASNTTLYTFCALYKDDAFDIKEGSCQDQGLQPNP